MDHPGRARTSYNEDGSPIPGTYHPVDQNPARIIVDSLIAPINGMYGIEGADGSISVYNSGELFGAIDVALFILVIGGFLGVTMQTGAIQAGIGRVVQRLRGREQLMIPILMVVFALGGTTYGMAEESLAFYLLIVTVMIAAGYDALTGRRAHPARRRDRRARLDDQPVRDGDRVRLRRGRRSAPASSRRIVILVVGNGRRDLVGHALRGEGSSRDPSTSLDRRRPRREHRALQGRRDRRRRPRPI